MRRIARHTLPVAVALTLSSCASAPADPPEGTQLTRVGQAVQLTEDPESVQECEYVTEVATQSRRSDDSLRVLRNEAGRAGVNFVLLVMDTRTTILRAEGYLCAD